MELSELTNTELKSILRENQVKNYSKLNKKDLVKKLNQLIKEQNSGKRNNRKNGKKKYKLKQLIGGGPPGEPGTPAELGAPRGPLEPRLAKNAINQNAAQIEGEQSQTSNNLVTSENGNQAANTKNDEQCKGCTIL